MKLSKKLIALSETYNTPFLIIDSNKITKAYRNIEKNISGVKIFYAVKANDHSEILRFLDSIGSSFEISSLNELNLLKSLNIKSDRIVCFNSIKESTFLTELAKYGVRMLAFDSKDEVDKIAKYAPNSKLVLRVTVDNEGSEWPLTKKFGVDASDALPLIKYALSKKIEVIGVTFHVGSQCLNKNSWANALYICHELWLQAQKIGIHLNFLSLGGGLPAHHIKDIPSLKEIGKTIQKTLTDKFKDFDDLRLTIEPGRGLVGDAGMMVSSVVGKAKRGNEDWVYIDVGVFNGLMETIQGITYEVMTKKRFKKNLVTVAGPSCDSVDIPFKKVFLSKVNIGDKLFIGSTGAYTTVYAASFNGFSIPKIHFIKEEEEEIW